MFALMRNMAATIVILLNTTVILYEFTYGDYYLQGPNILIVSEICFSH